MINGPTTPTAASSSAYKDSSTALTTRNRKAPDKTLHMLGVGSDEPRQPRASTVKTALSGAAMVKLEPNGRPKKGMFANDGPHVHRDYDKRLAVMLHTVSAKTVKRVNK